MVSVAAGRGRVTPWWERAGAPWRGKLFAEAILQPDDPEEQRIQEMREDLLQRYNTRDRIISMNRARLLTESYRATEAEHPAIRRAKAFDNILRKIPIVIARRQLLAGGASSGPGVVEVEAEFLRIRDLPLQEGTGERPLDDSALAGLDRLYVFPEEEKRVFEQEIWPYWKERCRAVYAIKQLKQYYPAAWFHCQKADAYLMPLIGTALIHTVQDYASILARGLKATKGEMRAQIASLEPATPANYGQDFERRSLYEAMLVCADAVIAYAVRCADECDRLAAAEDDAERRAELREMARICRKVPAEPAESWWEALQALHLLRSATALVEGGNSHSVGRLDQWLLPYLERDLAAGSITLQKAQELLESLFLKWNETRDLLAAGNVAPGKGNNDKINIGGMDVYGHDTTNRLTYMLLEAHAHVHLTDPNLTLRVHPHTPDGLLLRALEVLRLGGGLPNLLSDNAVISALVSVGGLSLAHARNYADLGCQENVGDPNMNGEADTNGKCNAGWFNLVKPIELAIFNGVNPGNGEQVGPPTGDPATFATMEDFFQAVKTQFAHAVRLNAIANNVADHVFARYFPCVFHDLMHPGPRRSGIDINAGGCRYNWTGHVGVGTANAGDSLAAIDHLIYRTKQATWPELLAALRANWAGYEELRRKCIAAPKYGTDDDVADRWTRRVLNVWFDAIEAQRTAHGGRFVGGLISMGSYITLGAVTGATPDGRTAGERFADAVSPSHYAPARGPTAVHRSVAKAVDGSRLPNGMTFNQRLNLGSIASERELSKWADLVRTYFDAGGFQVQYSVLDRNALIRAKTHPAEYRDLMVRVGGYSALFTELTPKLQDSIIARAEQEL